MKQILENDWNEVIGSEFEKEYYQRLRQVLKNEYKTQTIFPKAEEIFNALKYTNYNDVKVVILGQDPYHGVGEAHGLCFSVNKDIPIPPSLKNIYKELNSDLGCYIPNNGYLEKWAKQGVLLLNAVLTVRKDQAASHSKLGWQIFTDEVIKKVNEKDTPVVFMLWGNFARSKKSLITNPKHLILETVHPSPLSASNGFFGCKHFSKANKFLKENGLEEIDWQIENI